MSRFLFPMSNVAKPIGGWNVILCMIEILNAAGLPARPVYSSASYRYPFFDCTARAAFDTRLAGIFRPAGLRSRLRAAKGLLPSRPVNERLVLEDDDILAIPEFRFPEIAALYPSHRKVCVVQVMNSFVAALQRLEQRGGDASDQSYIATSQACAEAVREFARREPREIVLQVGRSGTDFVPEKALKIAYMPRKLPLQVELVVNALKASPEARDVEFVSLSGLTHEEVMAQLQDSLIFLSFSSAEGFGLPPAEAMAVGCIVIGYSGVGGDEFFTPDTGFPIGGDNITLFVRTVRDVLRRYALDPAPLDALRKRASDSIRSRYSETRFRESVLRVFSELDKGRVPA